jgi:hypothetical protein
MTVEYFKILQMAPSVKAIWLFDLRKREFRVLQIILKTMGIDLHVLPGRALRINPLQLSLGVEVSDWLPRIADMLVEVLQLPPRASKLLQTVLFPLYRRFDIEKQEFPTLYDLFEVIKKDKSSNPQARLAILDSLEPVLLSLGPKVLAYRYGWPSHELAKIHICFELAGYSEIDKNLILNSLLISEFSSRIARGISNRKMNLWICFDEAQRVCGGSGSNSAVGDQIGLVRGTGIGLDLSLKSVQGILPQIISNTATKVLGRCGSIADYTAAGHSMGLSAEQIHWAQMNLKPGMFIGQLGEGQWRYPFIFRIPPFHAPKSSAVDINIDDPLPHLRTIDAPDFDTWGTAADIGSSVSAQKESMFTSDQEYLFCKAVCEHPMQPSSSYPKLAGISSKNAKPVREQLVAKGYIREHRLDSGRRGRSTIMLEPLPEGIAATQKYGEKK